MPRRSPARGLQPAQPAPAPGGRRRPGRGRRGGGEARHGGGRGGRWQDIMSLGPGAGGRGACALGARQASAKGTGEQHGGAGISIM